MRAALYLRISEDPTGQRAGIDRQKPDCEALCDTRGWEVVHVFVDNDISAYSGKRRPAFEELLFHVEAGKVDAIVTWHPDRLIRRPIELERVIAILEKTKTQVATVTAGAFDLSTPTGRAVARTVGAWAYHESEHKSERVRRKARQLAEQGKLSGGGRRMFGYSKDGLTIVALEAALIREAADQVTSGASPRSVAEDWKRRGVETTYGGRWTSQSVKRLLSSPRLAAVRILGNKTIPGSWPAILTYDAYEALQGALRARETPRPGRPPVYLLSGIASCGLCLRPLYGKTEGSRRRVYVCLSESGGCGKISVQAAKVDDLIWEYVSSAIEAQGPWQQASASDEGPRRDLDSLRSRLSRLEDAYLDGGFDKGTYLTRRSDILRSISEMESQLFDRIVGPTGDVPVREWLTELDLESRRQLIRQYLLGVRIDPGTPGRFNPSRVTLLVESVGLRGREVTELTPPSSPPSS